MNFDWRKSEWTAIAAGVAGGLLGSGDFHFGHITFSKGMMFGAGLALLGLPLSSPALKAGGGAILGMAAGRTIREWYDHAAHGSAPHAGYGYGYGFGGDPARLGMGAGAGAPGASALGGVDPLVAAARYL